MEEGLSTSTSTPTYPPVSLPSSQHSTINILSLGATKASQMISDSLDKGDRELIAVEQISGENAIQKCRYGQARNARQIKPNNLKMFNFVLLANVVNNFAPTYTCLDKNCYWSANIMMDACIELFGLNNSTSPEDATMQNTYAPIDAHHSKISGHWKGWKVSHTNPDDLSIIIQEYKKAHTRKISEVEIFFF
jgi:hypothetical protein